MKENPHNPLKRLSELGQSVWCDELSRTMLEERTIDRMIEEWGLRGVTSNPTIFDKAIRDSDIYDSDIHRLNNNGTATTEIFDTLMLDDIAETADRFRPLYDASDRKHGFVSIEVSPKLAHQTRTTIEEALRITKRLARPNVLVKIPGTEEGLPAIRELLEQGVNVNITLLFSVDIYRKVAHIYCDALKARKQKQLSLNTVHSVASFFVSRVDTLVDDLLDTISRRALDKGDQGIAKFALMLKGKTGIANSKRAYQSFREIFYSDDFKELAEAGAQFQRPLWASSSVKNTDYRDVAYIEELIGKHTVNTMPVKTLEAFADHGRVQADRIEHEYKEVEKHFESLEEIGVDFATVTEQLLKEGVEKFSDSFDSALEHIEEKQGQ